MTRRLRIILLFAAALTLSCESPTTLLAPTGAQPADGKAADVAETKQEQNVDIDVQSLDPGLEKAGARLRENYAEFLEREPLGFDAELVDDVIADAAGFTDDYVFTLPGFSSEDFPERALPYAVALLLLFLFWLLNRQAWRLALRWQSGAYSGLSRFLTRAWRVSITVLGRCMPIAALLLLSYFPVQAIFESAPWTVALSDVLWLLLAYRALHAVITSVFALGLVRVSDRHADRLSRFGLWSLRIIFAFLALAAIIEAFEYRENAHAFVLFALKVAIALIPVYLYFVRSSVLALLPEHETTGGFYQKLRGRVGRYYYWTLTFSIILLGLWAAGYVRASTFILLRGYGIFLIVLATLVVGDRLNRWLDRREEEATEEQGELYGSISFFFRAVSILVLFWVVARLLGLWEPLLALMNAPLVEVGNVFLSATNLVSAILIFGFAILLGRVVRALLVIRVYPAFDVDVGVGYAINTLINYALILIGFFVALSALGINLSALTVVVASLGVGIGFGLQTLTENLISGFILLFGRSVKKGDIVTVGDTYGQVEAVGARSVLIKTPDNFDMLIPSKEIVGGRIVNWSYDDSLIRLHIPVGVTYRASPREVEEVLIGAARQHERVLADPAPEVWLREFGNSSINFTLLVYFDCRHITRDRLTGQLNFMIWDELAEAGIEIPFPQRDLHIRPGDWEELNELVARHAHGPGESPPDASADDEEPDEDDR